MGIKAFQNVSTSLRAFERLSSLVESQDYILLSSFFNMGVIRYTKPFLKTDTSNGIFIYPIRHLKKVNGFSLELHEHLKQIRNTLIAHDDIEQIEPRILMSTITLKGTDVHIPMSIAIGNKCISYPTDLKAVEEIKKSYQCCS